MSDQKAFDEIADAVHRLRRAFLQHGMEAPVSIELGSIRDKNRFLGLMPTDLIRAQARTWHDPARPELVANMLGMEIRMPAQWRRLENGGKVVL